MFKSRKREKNAETTTGSIYSRFQDKEGLFGALVEPAADYLINTFVKVQETVTEEFIHIITRALFESMFEVVRHKMEKEKAKCYMKMLEQYHYGGWNAIFHFDETQ